MSVPSGSGTIAFAISSGAAPRAGVIVVVYIAAGYATGWTFPASVDQEGDAFDVARDCYAVFEVQFDGRTLARTYTRSLIDTTAPTIVSATVEFAASSSLVVTFSEAVTARSALTGVTLLPWTSGTPKMIAGPPTGLGTTTHTYPLSAPVVNGDVFSISYGATSTYQDLNGNALAPVAQAVTNNVAPSILARPALIALWESTVGLVASGSNLNTWTDQKSGLVLHQAVGSGPVPITTVSTANGAVSLASNASAVMMETTAALDLSGFPTVVFYMLARDFYATAHSGAIFIEHGASYSVDFPSIEVQNSVSPCANIGGAVGYGGDGDIESATPRVWTEWHIVKVVFDKTTTSPNQVKVYVSNGAGAWVQKTSSPTARLNTGNFASKILHVGGRAGAIACGTMQFQGLGFMGFANTAAYAASTAADDAAVLGRWGAVFGVA